MQMQPVSSRIKLLIINNYWPTKYLFLISFFIQLVCSTATILQVEIANLKIGWLGLIGSVPNTIPRPVCSTLKFTAVDPLLAKRFTEEPISVFSNCLIGRSRQLHSHPESTGGNKLIVGPGGKKPTPVTSEIFTTKVWVPFVTVTKKSFTSTIVYKKRRGGTLGASAIVPRITVCPTSCCKTDWSGETQQSQRHEDEGAEGQQLLSAVYLTGGQ